MSIERIGLLPKIKIKDFKNINSSGLILCFCNFQNKRLILILSDCLEGLETQISSLYK